MKKIFFIFFVCCFHFSWANENISKQEINDQIKSILTDSRYQKEITNSVQAGNNKRNNTAPKGTPNNRINIPDFNIGGGSANQILYFLVIIIAAFVIFFILYLVLQNLGYNRHGDTKNIKVADNRIPHPLEKENIILGQSQDLEECRRILKKSLQLLFQNRCITSEKYLTNLEIIKSLSSDSPFKPPLQIMSDVIERGFYAQQSTTLEDYHKCLENLQIIQQNIKSLSIAQR